MQPEPWAAPPGWRSPAISADSRPSKKRSTTRSLWPPVTTTACGPSASTSRARSSWDSCSSPPRQRPRLGNVRRDDRGQRQQPLDQRRPRLVVEQHGAALGDHHRIEHHRRLADEAERLDHRLDRLRGAEHADLDRVDPDVFGDRADLGDDRLRRDRLDRLDPDRVLRRDRRDRGHPVHAAARKRLQVGLDAGATAGVRAGDRENVGMVLQGAAAQPRCWTAGQIKDAGSVACSARKRPKDADMRGRSVSQLIPRASGRLQQRPRVDAHERADDVAEGLEGGERRGDLGAGRGRAATAIASQVSSPRSTTASTPSSAGSRSGPERSALRTPGPSIASSTS